MRRDFPELPLTERNRLAFRWIPKGTPALLDAGCAWGYGTRFFSERAHSVAGIDFDQEAIEVAAKRYPWINFQAAPLEAIPHADQSFDVVVCLDVLEHVRDEHKSLNELFRVLRPGGMLILTTPHRGLFSFMDPVNVLRRLGRSDEPEHRHYSVGDLRRLLDASRWAGSYEIVRVHRSGLLLFPLALWLAAIPLATSVVRKLVDIAIEIDSFLRWGPLAYSVALKVRKLPASALADQGRGS